MPVLLLAPVKGAGAGTTPIRQLLAVIAAWMLVKISAVALVRLPPALSWAKIVLVALTMPAPVRVMASAPPLPAAVLPSNVELRIVAVPPHPAGPVKRIAPPLPDDELP